MLCQKCRTRDAYFFNEEAALYTCGLCLGLKPLPKDFVPEVKYPDDKVVNVEEVNMPYGQSQRKNNG